MAQVVCKGTVLKQTISSVLTAVAQVISLEVAESKGETYEADTLDNSGAGIPKKPTERAEGGDVTGELFFDPALAGHQAITDLITTPALCVWNIVFADSGSTVLAFTSASVGLGVNVDLADGLKAPFTLELDGIPTFAT